MKLPCFRRGKDHWGLWAPGCITFHHAEDVTLTALSGELCGCTYGYGSHCLPLDETFVYTAGRDGAYGVDVDIHTNALQGENYNNMYALCAAPTCARSPCTHGTCTDDVGSYTCSCENGWTGRDCDQVYTVLLPVVLSDGQRIVVGHCWQAPNQHRRLDNVEVHV
ncbi:protein crumbs homolog 1-like [Branchiostoma floridae]|uniref:Protein crumbs homolog 1-like n=1 Tax=Branchiostoma floridae TaxID=7739 RepID=A0A9J7M3R7_BRAFL|nr:protein crumbs homolog 1-like [Branchiostoma floridae]